MFTSIPDWITHLPFIFLPSSRGFLWTLQICLSSCWKQHSKNQSFKTEFIDLPGLEVTGETSRDPFFPTDTIPTDTRKQLLNFLTSVSQRDVKTPAHSTMIWVLSVRVSQLFSDRADFSPWMRKSPQDTHLYSFWAHLSDPCASSLSAHIALSRLYLWQDTGKNKPQTPEIIYLIAWPLWLNNWGEEEQRLGSSSSQSSLVSVH